MLQEEEVKVKEHCLIDTRAVFRFRALGQVGRAGVECTELALASSTRSKVPHCQRDAIVPGKPS